MQTSRSGRATGSVSLVERTRGPVYYAKLRLPDGRQVQRKLGAAWMRRGRPEGGALTQRMADARLRELLVEAERGTLAAVYRSDNGRTFDDAAAEYLRYIEHERQRRPSTLRDYRNTVNCYLLPALGAEALAGITTDRVEALRSELLTQRGLSRRSVQKTMVLLHGIFKRAKRLKWIAVNPSEDAERVSVPRSGDFNVLEPAEVLRVAAAARSEQDAALITVAAFTGLRLGELRELRWRDVDFAKQTVLVRGSFTQGRAGPPKSGKVRSVPLIDQAATVLDRISRRPHFTAPEDLVFCSAVGEHRDDSSIRRAFYAALDASGLGGRRLGPKPMRFHDLRHTFGTLAVEAWPVHDVQAYMGHAHLSTTEIYIHHRSRATAAAELTRLVEAAVAPQALTTWSATPALTN